MSQQQNKEWITVLNYYMAQRGPRMYGLRDKLLDSSNIFLEALEPIFVSDIRDGSILG